MKVLFFGLGAIGLRHAKLLKKHYRHDLFALRSNPRQSGNRLGIQELFSWEEIDRVKPDVAFITNPTFLHIETAIRCARKGMHLFIEKPLDSQTKSLNRFLKIVDQQRISTYVAYVLRFHPVILELKKQIERSHFLHLRVQTTSLLHHWRPKSNTKESYSAHKNKGGGVILDLSHELDYVQFLIGNLKNFKGQSGRRSNITVDSEDYADILVQSKNGPANIHINFLSQQHQRIVQVDLKNKTLVGDLVKNTIAEYKNGRLVKQKKLKGSLSNCYETQTKYFFKNIGNRKMMNHVGEAADLFRKICAFRKSV